MKSISKFLSAIILLLGSLALINLMSNFSFDNNGLALLSIGLVLIISFTLGEFLALFKLPKITGYILTGILFGPYSNLIFHFNSFALLFKDYSDIYQVLYGLVLGLMFFIIGSSYKINVPKEIKLSSYLLTLVNSLFFIVALPFVFLIVQNLIPTFFSSNSIHIFVITLLISIFLIDSSPEITFAVIEEQKENSLISRILLNTSILKSVLLALPISLSLLASHHIISPDENSVLLVGLKILSSLILTIISGIILGVLFNTFLKISGKESAILLLGFILLSNEISSQLNLISPVLFLTFGFIVSNYTKEFEDVKDSILNYAPLIFLIYFTLTPSSFDFTLLPILILPVLLIFIVRLTINFISSKIALSVLKYDKSKQNTFWLGLTPQGTVILILLSLITNNLGQDGQIVYTFSSSLIFINFLIGSPLVRLLFGFMKLKQKEAHEEVKPSQKIEFVEYKKFKVPEIESETLSNLVKSLREILIKYHKEFESFVNTQSEQSIEFYYQVVEKYIDEYRNLKSFIIEQRASGKNLKSQILKIQQELARWFADLSLNRLKLEESFFEAESLLQSLFDKLEIYCNNSPEYIIVEQEQDKYEYFESDNLVVRGFKIFKRLDLNFRHILGIKSRLKRKIPYLTLIKYYFEYQISQEMKEVAFIIGMERLNTLRKIKTIFDDVNKNLEELLNLVSAYKEIQAISTIAIDKLNEIHEKLKQEITSIQEEVNTSTINTCTRLQYAFSNPFNEFLETLNKAGTIEINLRKFQFSRLIEKTENTKESTRETLRYWKNYLQGFLGICQRDARTIQIMGKIKDLIDDTIVYQFDEIYEDLRNKNQQLISLIRKIDKEISKDNYHKFENVSEFISFIKKSYDEILFLVRNREKLKLFDNQHNQSTVTLSSLLKEHFKQVIEEFKAHKDLKVLNEKDIEKIHTQTQYIPLKPLHYLEIVQNYFEIKILPEILELQKLITAQINNSLSELQNIENIVKFHFNVAFKEIDETINSDSIQEKSSEISRIIHEHVKSPISLLLEKIKTWNKQIENFQIEFELTLIKKIDDQISNLKDIFKEKAAEAEKQKEEPTNLKKLTITMQFIFNFIINKSQIKFSQIISSIKGITKKSFEEVKGPAKLDLEGRSIILYSYNQTQLNQDVYNSLPQIYRGLFNYTTTDFPEILVGRKNEKELLKEAYERSKCEQPASCSIIGETGTGKSSLISNFLLNFVDESSYITYVFKSTIYSESKLLNELKRIFKYEHVHSFNDLISELLINPPAQIIVLEDIHKLFLRKTNGLDALKKLLLLISETNHKIFWIVSISFHAWQLLNKIIFIDNYFTHQIKTENLRKEEIYDAIMKRQNTFNYKVEFLAGDSLLLKKKIKYHFSNQEVQKILEDEFFNKLFKVTEGNITAALFYWLKSIKEFKNNTIYINPLEELDLSFIQNLHIVKILTLSNLILHGSLTAKEHCEIFRMSEDESKAIFNFLTSANLVHATLNENGEKVYSINQAIYKPLEIEIRKLGIF